VSKNIAAILKWIDDIAAINVSRVSRNTVTIVHNVQVTYYDTKSEKTLYANSNDIYYDSVNINLIIHGMNNPLCQSMFNPQFQTFEYLNGILLIKWKGSNMCPPYEVTLS